ncbi:hypothetical protein FHY30_003823 [Xanthomonas arboricola]|uniref:hypothetical protein n=1 Tax=Xanthomonas campestris TaxID=339 RepID=UPI0023E92DD0|nr:hypothetical protein [Xanthomonas campestris]
MRKAQFTKLIFVAVAAAIISACGTNPAPDFGGRWKPVNRFAKSAMEIPLYTSYVYQATPMDGTLKTMLERWTKDSNMTLAYNLPSDFTLYGGVSKISTSSVQQATVELSAVYAAQGVSVSVMGNQIVVQSASSATSSSTSSGSTQ